MLSIIITFFNEEESVLALYDQLKMVLDKLTENCEIICIDDGSSDGTYNKLIKINELDKRVRIIKLRRNFGKSVALNVAFRHIKGNIIITLDGDLQDDPKEIPRFIDKLSEGNDLVNGWKFERKDPMTKRAFSKIFNFLSSSITGVKIHDFNCGFKAYKRELLDNVYLYGNMHRYIPAFAQRYGFRIAEIKVEHHPRVYGKSKYGLSRIIKGFLDLMTIRFLTGYSSSPLQLFGMLGIISFLIGTFFVCLISFLKHSYGYHDSDRFFLQLAILLLIFSIQFLFMGLLGEMIVEKFVRQEIADIYIEEII